MKRPTSPKLLPWAEHLQWCQAMPDLARQVDDIEQERLASLPLPPRKPPHGIPAGRYAPDAESLAHLSVVVPEGVVSAAEYIEALEATLHEVAAERDQARRRLRVITVVMAWVILVLTLAVVYVVEVMR